MSMIAKLKEVVALMRKDAEDDDYTPDCILAQSLNSYSDKIDEILKEADGDCCGKNLAAMSEFAMSSVEA